MKTSKKKENGLAADCGDHVFRFGRYLRIYEQCAEGQMIVFELYEEPAVASGEPEYAETQREIFDFFEQLFKEGSDHDL